VDITRARQLQVGAPSRDRLSRHTFLADGAGHRGTRARRGFGVWAVLRAWTIY